MSESGEDRLIVHMVGNAHIDPVWLWNWQAGVDEALASFRSAADRCDEYPEFIYTRGESWLYRQIESLDPQLFARVLRLVERGQWHISGGQFLQPDVNGPTEAGLRKQFEHGLRYFEARFGVRPTVGYNLDSFGHPATLPDILRSCGYDAYVFHRPKPDQVELPASAFRWRGSGGGEVLAYRIVPGYTTLGEDLTEQIEKAIAHADRSVGHAMCFYGVGNHGGGPTKADIEFIIGRRYAFDDVELRFSTPASFFAAISARRDRLPLVDTELQHTFPGCYSVMHDVKQAQRHGEHLLEQASAAMTRFAGERAERLREKYQRGWEDLLFTSFHDILAGTSIPSAWQSVRAMQGRARIEAEEILVESTRSWARGNLPPVNYQQLVVMNPEDDARREWIEHEPWLDMDPWGDRWLSDMEGNPVDFQRIQPEAPQITSRILVPVEVAAGGSLQLLIRDDAPPAIDIRSDLRAEGGTLVNGEIELRAGDGGIDSLRWRGHELLGAGGIGLHLRRDGTDTWTFHTDRFREPVEEKFSGARWSIEESGPLRARLRAEGRLGTSRLRWTVDLYRGEPVVAMRLEVNFDERYRLLQLPIDLAAEPGLWTAGLAGGSVTREQGEAEWPVQGWALTRPGGASVGLVSQDIYSASLEGSSWQWTLLRSPRMAWGGGDTAAYAGRDHFTDQGVHIFDLQLHLGDEPAESRLESAARRVVRPLVTFDRYEGMNRPLGRRTGSEPIQALFQRDEEEGR